MIICALYPLGPVATLRFCHLRPRCVSKQRRTTNVIITDRVWWIWCDAGLAAVATRPQRLPHSVASNSRPAYFAATRSRSLFLTKNECCVSAAAAAIWEIQWRRTYAAAGPRGYRGHGLIKLHFNHVCLQIYILWVYILLDKSNKINVCINMYMVPSTQMFYGTSRNKKSSEIWQLKD